MADVSLPNLTVAQLEYLVAVSKADTWAEAAIEVGVTPSALSQGLAELERRLGVPLFERQGRRRVITADATVVLRHAEAMLSHTHDLARWAEGHRLGTLGQIRLGMIDAAAIYHYSDALKKFRIDRPAVDLHLTVAPSAALLTALDRGEIDVAVCVSPLSVPSHIEIRELLVEPLRIYAPSQANTTTTPANWGPWVTFPPGSHSRELIAKEIRALGNAFEVIAESHQPDVLRGMVNMGIGWTILPISQAELGPEPLRPVKQEPVAYRRLIVAQRTSIEPNTALNDLINALVKDTPQLNGTQPSKPS